VRDVSRKSNSRHLHLSFFITYFVFNVTVKIIVITAKHSARLFGKQPPVAISGSQAYSSPSKWSENGAASSLPSPSLSLPSVSSSFFSL